MKRHALLAALASLLIARVAVAQETSVVEGPGYKIGEGTVLHPSVGVQAGVDTNVFHQDANPILSPVLRVLAELDIGSAPKQRTQVGAEHVAHQLIEFRGGADLLYNEYLSNNSDARSQRNLGIGARAHLGVTPQGTFAGYVDDDFIRDTRPPNYETTGNVLRDINKVRVMGVFQPGGRALTAKLRFVNVVDVFEDNQVSFANRLQNTLGLRVDWRFLPVTLFYADASIGFFGPLGNSSLGGTQYKVSSHPLRAVLGANTAITQRTTAQVYAGYGQGFYASGPDFSGPLVGATFGYRYSPLGRVTLGYDYDFQDSVDANYYNEHELKLTVDQQVKLFLVKVGLQARLRSYHGIPAAFMPNPAVRTDFILRGLVNATYHYRDWFAFVASYTLSSVKTDFRYTFQGVTKNPSFVENVVWGGVRAAF